ncbi:MAG TPA: hypothetical protein VK761_08965 [Solirubrobacteraceae bacterium]|nr:hypothetical protein [Solirubrobacteraceae bacterium]
MRRAPIALVALVLGASLLAACGKSSLNTSAAARSTTRAARSRSNGSPHSGTPTRADALAFARAVNLTQADVPGFTATEKHASSSARERALERQMLSCTGLSGGGGSQSIVEQSSKDFRLKRQIVDLSVSSEVSVAASAAAAARGLKALRSAHIRGCFSSYLTHVLQGEHVAGATPGRVSIQSGTPPAPGTSGSFGWRVTATFVVHQIKLPIYLDFLGFVDGPSEVTLLSSGLLQPFPAEAQQHLYTLLLARAKAHAL